MLIAVACALGLVFTSTVPAHAAGMRTVSGNMRCTAFPNVTIGTAASAKGTVAFQLNTINNTGVLYYQTLGYTTNYANWNWKFWTTQAGNFYAYGLGASGAVASASRWCNGI